jgi:hypothetical protein
MSYAADMGAGRHKTREEAAQREHEMVDTIARQLDLRPIPEAETKALSLGVAWGTENAYALTDILAELADRGREREPSERLMEAARRYNERALARDKQRMIDSRTLDGVKTGVVLGDETNWYCGVDEQGPYFSIIDRDFHDPHADADPAEHTIPYGWIRTVADAYYGGKVSQVLQDMQLTPAALYEFGIGRIWSHAEELVEQIGRFISGDGQTCPGIFTERLQAVNSYLQQVDNEETGDATS